MDLELKCATGLWRATTTEKNTEYHLVAVLDVIEYKTTKSIKFQGNP